MSDWSPDMLRALRAAALIRVAPLRADGTPGRFVPIGVVVVGDAVLIRSLRGRRGRWYRAVSERGLGVIDLGGEVVATKFAPYPDDARIVDDAYRRKYGNDAGVRAMLDPDAAGTTLRLHPA